MKYSVLNTKLPSPKDNHALTKKLPDFKIYPFKKGDNS